MPFEFIARNLNRGFTLIELMIAMVLSLFLIGGVIFMYLSTKVTYQDVEQLSRLQENIRFASDYLIRDIRNAGFRDEMTLTIGNAEEISDRMAEISGDGDELTIRYAGRGHCARPFSESDDTEKYFAVENRYYLDADSGELMCEGASIDEDGNRQDVASQALVGGLSDLHFRLVLADPDADPSSSDHVCVDSDLVIPEDRCIGVVVGIVFTGLRDSSGSAEERFIELVATFRNSAMDWIYAPSADT